MHKRIRGPRTWAVLTAALASIAVAGCGTATNSDPSTLLKETFSGSHPVNSGNLSFKLSVQPKGSSTLTGPITLSFGGPFQSMGKGKLPQSNLSLIHI